MNMQTKLIQVVASCRNECSSSAARWTSKASSAEPSAYAARDYAHRNRSLASLLATLRHTTAPYEAINARITFLLTRDFLEPKSFVFHQAEFVQTELRSTLIKASNRDLQRLLHPSDATAIAVND